MTKLLDREGPISGTLINKPGAILWYSHRSLLSGQVPHIVEAPSFLGFWVSHAELTAAGQAF